VIDAALAFAAQPAPLSDEGWTYLFEAVVEELSALDTPVTMPAIDDAAGVTRVRHARDRVLDALLDLRSAIRAPRRRSEPAPTSKHVLRPERSAGSR
jgi:hypothetical protein